jgi:hypothetical protein
MALNSKHITVSAYAQDRRQNTRCGAPYQKKRPIRTECVGRQCLCLGYYALGIMQIIQGTHLGQVNLQNGTKMPEALLIKRTTLFVSRNMIISTGMGTMRVKRFIQRRPKMVKQFLPPSKHKETGTPRVPVSICLMPLLSAKFFASEQRKTDIFRVQRVCGPIHVHIARK